MTEPITPERLAELDRRYGSLTPDAYAHDHPATHAAELLAEVKRLNQRVAELEGDLSALRGWTRSRLQVLADRRSEYPETPEQRGKTEVLDDLTRVLHHLDTIPAPNAAPTEESGR